MKLFFRSDVNELVVPLSADGSITHHHEPQGIPEVGGPHFVECNEPVCIEQMRIAGGTQDPHKIELTYDERIEQEQVDRENDRLSAAVARELAAQGVASTKERMGISPSGIPRVGVT